MAWSRIFTLLASPIPAKLLMLFLFVNHSTLTQLCHRQLLLLAGPSAGFTGQGLWHGAKWIVEWMTDDQISTLSGGGTQRNCCYYLRNLSKHCVP